MIIVRETTVWKTNVPNHIYKLSNDKRSLYGYTNVRTGESKDFIKKLPFSPSHRTFELIEKIEDEKSSPADMFYKVMGSNGNMYTVTDNDGVLQCSCPGFSFRGKCKHTEKK